jgi:5-methylcytosine-specific restriction endonuclease McrA
MLVFVFTIHFHPWYTPFLIICAILGFVMVFVSSRIQKAEAAKRQPKVTARLEELARERQKKIEDANAFYASPEWRLLRQKVIEQHGRVCQECGRHITDDFDVTVDHVNPRSIYPSQGFDVSNLRVLCRSCNAKKGNTIPE